MKIEWSDQPCRPDLSFKIYSPTRIIALKTPLSIPRFKKTALCISPTRDRCQWHENCKFIHTRHSHQLVHRHLSCLCCFYSTAAALPSLSFWSHYDLKVDCLPKNESIFYSENVLGIKSVKYMYALLLTWLLFKPKPAAMQGVFMVNQLWGTHGNRHAN